MKNVVFLYAGATETHAFDVLFDGKSAFSRCLDWVRSVKDCVAVRIATVPSLEPHVKQCLRDAALENAVVICNPEWNTASLIEAVASNVSSADADTAVYAAGDRPFLDMKLTEQLLENHVSYLAEYTFADGYPLGLTPEIVDKGTLAILSSLAKDKARAAGDAPVSANSLFSIIQSDINAFEIETVIAPRDYRMLRLDFSCSNKARTLACEALYREAKAASVPFEAEPLSELASSSAAVQATVPAFYTLQIAQNVASVPVYNPYIDAFKKKNGVRPVVAENSSPADMDFGKFETLIDDIARFSETAVVSLSGFTEPLTVPHFLDYVACVLKKRGLSVLIETDGLLVTPELAQRVAQIASNSPARTGEWPAVMWIVSVDAVSEAMYRSVRPESVSCTDGLSPFKTACSAVATLAACFPGCVYPQFMRMDTNESELESFYRFYNDSNSPSAGKLIIQKYDSYCGVLPDKKSADLSPLERMPCWHIKRDIFVFPDGSVPLCREHILDGSVGNIFNDGLEKIWAGFASVVKSHLDGQYYEKCRNCDEYYTFNF